MHLVPLIISTQNYDKIEGEIPLKPRFGDGLKVAFAHFPLRFIGEDQGKNYALFHKDGLPEGQILVEVQPFGGHRSVQQIRIDDMQTKSRNTDWKTIADVTTIGGPEITEELPPPTFSTIDELWFKQPIFKEGFHGGACCVSIQTPETARGATTSSENLLVGIAHNKVPLRPWMMKATPEQLLDLNHHCPLP